jgi:hypothetical protein
MPSYGLPRPLQFKYHWLALQDAAVTAPAQTHCLLSRFSRNLQCLLLLAVRSLGRSWWMAAVLLLCSPGVGMLPGP